MSWVNNPRLILARTENNWSINSKELDLALVLSWWTVFAGPVQCNICFALGFKKMWNKFHKTCWYGVLAQVVLFYKFRIRYSKLIRWIPVSKQTLSLFPSSSFNCSHSPHTRFTSVWASTTEYLYLYCMLLKI